MTPVPGSGWWEQKYPISSIKDIHAYYTAMQYLLWWVGELQCSDMQTG